MYARDIVICKPCKTEGGKGLSIKWLVWQALAHFNKKEHWNFTAWWGKMVCSGLEKSCSGTVKHWKKKEERRKKERERERERAAVMIYWLPCIQSLHHDLLHSTYFLSTSSYWYQWKKLWVVLPRSVIIVIPCSKRVGSLQISAHLI